MSKVLIADALSPRAAEILSARGIEVDFMPGLPAEELKGRIADCDGLAVRSATKVTKASGPPRSRGPSAAPVLGSTILTSRRRRSGASSS